MMRNINESRTKTAISITIMKTHHKMRIDWSRIGGYAMTMQWSQNAE